MSIRSFCILATLLATIAIVNCSGESPLTPSVDERVDEQSSSSVVSVGSARAERQMKFTICHVPPGNPDNAHEITVAEAALPAHFPHGDTFGECEDEEEDSLPEECSGICSELEEECCEARIDCNWTFDDLENLFCEAVPES